jgi:uncharacterized phage protein (TIGR01671 family)
MSNLIKFRGFRVDNDKPIYGDLLQINGESYIYPNEFGDLQDTDFGYSFINIYLSSLGMFTGLTDKNGKEIYGAIGERGGDVIQVDNFGITNNRVVSYVSQSARFHLMGTTHDNLYEALHDISGKNRSKIIGNQWEVDNGK